jgi:hypothetical protein
MSDFNRLLLGKQINGYKIIEYMGSCAFYDNFKAEKTTDIFDSHTYAFKIAASHFQEKAMT